MAKINDVYDIGAAFEAIENELMASMIRNMKRHKAEESDEKMQWSMWQTEMLKSLEKYKHDNKKKYGKQFKDINAKISGLIAAANIEGQMEQEKKILEAIRKGFPAKRVTKGGTAEFFKLNDRKLEALIKATTDDMEKAEAAVLRMANDQYRKIIYNAQVYANTGAATYETAVDMATKDFLKAGLNCIQYANGARHTIADYADMAIRTASKRAYLQGEGVKRQEWGVHTVIINKRGSGCPCPLCVPFVGKVMVDDVWSGGTRKEASETGYKLLSEAIAAGLYHPRCRDSHTTYFPGISTPPDGKFTKQELKKIEKKNKQESRQQYAERQEKQYGRLADFSLDPDNQRKYEQKQKEWENISEQGTQKQIEQFEKQFTDLTEGYTYDDFIKDFGSIEEGFEGAEEEEMQKAKEIAEEIEKLRNKLKAPKASTDIIRTKEESIETFADLGIAFKDNSTDGISEKKINKLVEFVTNFEQSHAGYFVRNKLQLNSISIVDDLKVQGSTAAGAYYGESSSIKLMKKAIDTKPTSTLQTYSKSDDYQIHFFAHEYGHYIADSLKKNLSVTDYDVIQKSLLRYFEKDIFRAKTINLVDELGSYGSKNANEAFAEAFAEAYTCKKPGKFAKIFKDELEKVLSTGVEKKATSDIMISGARITDIFSKEADEFAEMYYKEIRSFSTDSKKIADNLGKDETDIRKIKAYLFEDDSLLDTETGKYRRFDPDCAIAQSWQRLMAGKDIKQHDRTLIEHELLEMKIKKENPDMEHWKAHQIASEKYDYPKEAMEYYGDLEKHKKDK